MKTMILALSSLLFLSSCTKEQTEIITADGIITKTPTLWKTSTSDDGQLVQVVSETHISYDRNVLVGGNKNQNRSLISLNVETGKANWEWNDLLSLINDPTYKDPISLDEDAYYIRDNKLIFLYSTSTYCLDLISGNTVRKQKVNQSRADDLQGLGDLFFYSGVPRQRTGNPNETVYVGTVTGGDLAKSAVQPIYDSTLVLPNTGAYGRTKRIFPFVQNADTC